jgi:uncharacterized protein with GYD domain
MSLYLAQVAYTPEAWRALVRNPQDRFEAVRPAVEKLGGKLVSAWFAFGDYDIVAVTDMPSNVAAAAISIVFAAGGACKAVKTTPLLTTAEALEALKAAGTSGYRPATAAAAASRK